MKTTMTMTTTMTITKKIMIATKSGDTRAIRKKKAKWIRRKSKQLIQAVAVTQVFSYKAQMSRLQGLRMEDFPLYRMEQYPGARWIHKMNTLAPDCSISAWS